MTGRSTPTFAIPLAAVRRKSWNVQCSIGFPPFCVVTLLSRRSLAFAKPLGGLSPALNRNGESAKRRWARRILTASGASGIVCSRRFLLRTAGKVHSAPSRSSSSQTSPPTSSRRCAVRISERTIGPKGKPRPSAPRHQRKLVIGQRPFPRHLRRGTVNSLTWIELNDSALDRPRAHFAQLGEDAVCADRCAAVDHFVEQFRDVLSFNFTETSPTPSRHDVLLQDALGLSPIASVSRGVQLDKVVDDDIDHVVFLRARRGSCGRLFGGRVLAGGDIAERRCSAPPGLGNRDQWVRPDRELLGLAARAVSQSPR